MSFLRDGCLDLRDWEFRPVVAEAGGGFGGRGIDGGEPAVGLGAGLFEVGEWVNGLVLSVDADGLEGCSLCCCD